MAISEKLSGDTVGVRLGQPYRQSTLGAVGNFFDREDVLGYLLLVPVLVILGVFVGYPFVYGVWLAFTDTTIVHQGQFTGLDNLERLLGDSIFRQAASNSFIYTGVTTVFKLVLGLAMAAILNVKFRLNRFVRSATLLPPSIAYGRLPVQATATLLIRWMSWELKLVISPVVPRRESSPFM